MSVVAAIIQARMGSTRFPGKSLYPVAGRPLIWHLIHRLKQARAVTHVCVATTTDPSDDPLAAYAAEQGAVVVRGSVDNVLERYLTAARRLEAEVVIRVTGDSPLVAPDIIDAMTKVFQYSMLSAPIMSQYAACEALRRRHQDVPGMIESYNQRRRYIVEGLREAGLDCHMPEGAFYAFPNVKKFGLSSREFCLRLLKEEKVASVPGGGFGASGEGYARCCYAISIAQSEQAVEKIARFVKRL